MRTGLFSVLFLLAAVPVAMAGERRVSIETSDGWRLYGALHTEPGLEAAPVCILVHDLARSRADWEDLSAHLVKSGFRTFCFDLRGHGESLACQDVQRGWKSFGADDFRRMILDLQAAIRLVTEGQGESAPVYLVGAGLGANLALLAAGEDPRVKACVLLSPGLELRGISLVSALRAYSDGSVLVVSGETHDRQGKKASETLNRLRRPHLEIVTRPGAHKGIALVREDEVSRSHVLKWLEREREKS